VTAGESDQHVSLAQQICKLVPSAERVRFASTGTEATAVALRLARHVAGRNRFLKFEGHFHGLSDSFLFQQRGTFHMSAKPVAASGGVPTSQAYDVEIVSWNAPDAFELAARLGYDPVLAVDHEPRRDVWYNSKALLRQPLREPHGALDAPR
jgi:glutamate-1-semialdehyde 2,1-aminomutase